MSVLNESFRLIGAEVDIDHGHGWLTRVPTRDLDTITIRGSLDGWGAREASFTWRRAPSPRTTATLRAASRVTVKGLRGKLGEPILTTPLVDGYVRSADHAVHPQAATITVQDQLLGLAKPANYTKAARVLVSREAVITEICDDVGITIGSFDWPDEGGSIVGEINEAGGRTVGAFIAEFIAPTGCRMYQRDGTLNIRPFTPEDDAVKTLPLSLIRNLRVVPPTMDTPNVVTVTSGLYPYTGPDRTGTEVETDEVPFGPGHVVRVAYEKQDKTTGAITSVSPSTSPGLNPWSRVVTTTVYEGGTVKLRTREVWGWKAPIAGQTKVVGAVVLGHNDLFDCYHYAHDDSWRSQPAETFQIVATYITTRAFDEEGFLQVEQDFAFDFRELESARSVINTGASSETGVTGYVRSSGRALLGGKEVYGSHEIVITTHHRATSGAGKSDRYGVKYIASTASSRQPYMVDNGYVAGSVNLSAPLYVFGTGVDKRYARLHPGHPVEVQVSQVYAEVTETSHEVTTTKTVGVVAINATTSTVWLAYFNGTETFDYRLPRPEMHTNLQVPEPYTYTVRDDVRIKLNGGVEIPEFVENQWCQSWMEMRVLALERIRELSAPAVTFDTDADFEDLQEGNVVTIPRHPAFAFEDTNVLIWAQQSSVDVRNGANSHAITGREYPKELTVLPPAFSVSLP